MSNSRERALWILALAGLIALPAFAQTNVVLRLKNGDRLLGTIISENSTNLVIATTWIKELSVPLSAVEQRESAPTEGVAGTTPPAATNVVVATPPPITPPPPKTVTAVAPKNWKANVEVGANMVFGAVDRQLYWGKLNFTYAQPYKSNPKKFFRTILDYNADYGESDGVKSADRMGGSVKTDFDVGTRVYLYNLAGMGYDEIRKIDLQYQIGPGVGYHLFTMPKFAMNTEAGLNYQAQDRDDAEDTRSMYGRLAEDVTWRIFEKVTFTEKFEFFPNLEESGEWRARLEATLSFPLVNNFTLNFQVIDIYDTDPASGVDKNELQFRSSIGVSF